MYRKKIPNVENNTIKKDNELEGAYRDQFRKMEYEPRANVIPKTKEVILTLERGNNVKNLDIDIKNELLKKEQERQRYEEILKTKAYRKNIVSSEDSDKNANTESNSLQQTILELVNTSSTTNSLLANISTNLGVSNKNPNNISNVNNGHKDFIFEFDSKYRNRNLPSNLDPNTYFSFSLANVKSTDNIYLGNIGVGYPLENVIEMEINSITIPNILKSYDETIRKKRINVQIVELIDKNVIETSSISEWKDKHFIFEINQYVEYDNTNKLIINDNYLKLVPVVNKIRFPVPVTKIDKLTFIFSLEDAPLVFNTDLIMGNLSIGPLLRTNVYTESPHNLSVNDLLVISDSRNSDDLINTDFSLKTSMDIIDPNLNNNLTLSTLFPENGDSVPDPNSEFINSDSNIIAYYYNKSNMNITPPNFSTVFRIRNLVDYSNLMLYHLNNVSKNMSNLYYKMMLNNINDYFKLLLNSKDEFKISNVIDDYNFNFLVNSYSFFVFTDPNDLNYSATLSNIESIILIIDSVNNSNKKITDELSIESAVLTENQYLYIRNNISLFNINRELYAYNDKQSITIKVTIVITNLTYSIYFDEISITEYILYNNNTYIFDQSDSSNLNNKLEFSTTKPTQIIENYVSDEFKTAGGLNVTRYNIDPNTSNANPKYNGIAGITNGNTTLVLNNILLPQGTILYCFTENISYSGSEIKLTIADPILPNYRNILENDFVDTLRSAPLPVKVQQEYPNVTNNDPTETYADYVKNISYLEEYINNKDLKAIAAAQSSLASAVQNTSSATTTLSDFRMQWGLVSNLYNNATYFIKMLNAKKIQLYLLAYEISYLQWENSSLKEDNVVTLYITVKDNKYYINNNRTEELTLYVGNTYIFNLSDSSNLGDGIGFKFSTNAESGEYTTNITRVGVVGASGSYIRLILNTNTPSVLYFYSSNRSGMGGIIKVKKAFISELTTNMNNLSLTNEGYTAFWNNINVNTSKDIFKVTVESGKFYINNVKSSMLALNLLIDDSYEFDLTDISLSENNVVFRLCYTEDGNTYDTNVVLTEIGIRITITQNTPNILFYKNVNANNYGGKIMIYENNAMDTLAQMTKKNLLSLFKNYYMFVMNNSTNNLKKLELIFNNDKEILEKTKEYNLIKNIIINHYKANVDNFNIENYDPNMDIEILKEKVKNVQDALPNEFSSYEAIMGNYEKTKNDLMILLKDLGNRKYNVMENNNTFIWTENYNGTSENIASSIKSGTYTIFELVKEIEYILNKDSPNKYLYTVNIDYNNLNNVNNELHRVTISCNIPDTYVNNVSNGFKIRYDLTNLYDLLFNAFNINFQNSPYSDYSYYNALSALTVGNNVNVINGNTVVKRPIQLGQSRKVLTVYEELNNNISGQDIICVLREFDPSTNTYNTLNRLKLKSLSNDLIAKKIYLCKLFYDESNDNNKYYNLIIFDNKLYLVEINAVTDTITLMEESIGLVNFSGEIDKNYEPICIRDNNVSNNNKIVIFYDISTKKFKTLVINVNGVGEKVSIGNELNIVNNLMTTTNMGSIPLTTTDLSGASIIEVSGVLKMDDYQQIWALTIIEANTKYSTILCHMMYMNNTINCIKTSYINGYSGINDSTAFFTLSDNVLIWIGKNYYVRNIGEVYDNKKIKIHILSLSTNQFILNYSDSTILNSVNERLGNNFVLDVITGRKLQDSNKFYLIHSNYYYNSNSDFNKSISLLLLNYDNITYKINVENSFVINDEDVSAESIYYYLFGNNTNSANAYYNPQVLFYFNEYNIHHWYYTCKYDNPVYKNYISFVMIDDLISDPMSTRFTLNKNYLGEITDYNVASALGIKYTSTNNVFDLLYAEENNYNIYSTDLINNYKVLCKLRNYNDNLSYYNDYIKTLNNFINLRDYIINYTRTNNTSYASIENILTEMTNYYDEINEYTQRIYLIDMNLEHLKEYSENINANINLLNRWRDDLNKYTLKLNKNLRNIYLKNIEVNNSNNLLNTNSLTDLSIDNLISYYKNYIEGGEDDNNTEFTGYLQQLRTLNGEINIYSNYVNPENSNTTSDSILSSFTAALGQAQSDYNYHTSLLIEYKSSLKILLNKIYSTSVNDNYKQAATNFLLNNANYEKVVVNKTQILSIINNLSTQLLDSKNKIANYEFSLAKNNLDLINNNKFLLDLNFEVFNKLFTKWILSRGNDNKFNRIYIQNLILPNIPFYIANRRFQITLRLRVLNDAPTQGILNI